MDSTSSQFVSQLRGYLSKDDDVTIPRHVLIFSGETSWLSDSVSTLLEGNESRALWLTREGNGPVSNLIPSSTFKKASHWLGGEKKVVVFDVCDDFDVDAFAAISGVVIGGGLFILLLPEENKWNDVYSSLFGQRFLKSILQSPDIILIKQNDKNVNFQANEPNNDIEHNIVPPFLTKDQQLAVERIEQQVLKTTKNPIVLISDRGRGKSATLGVAAARLIKSGVKNIVITAPRLRATDIVFKHIKDILPTALITRGRVELAESSVKFYSPDQLVLDDINADLLLIDEAAGIPVPLLTTLLKKYRQCVYATTVHGYEGTGRGFSLRFNKILNKHNPGWTKLQMKTPIRWPVNDTLEKWMFDLLCLDAEVVDVDSETKINLDNVEHRLISKRELSEKHLLLKEVFALLVIAHYRTRPKDLKSLLDDDNIFLYVSLHNNHIVAVALVIQEGCFSNELSTEVYKGERRPQGHLLAQALTYHCGVEHAATLDYSRVMRIAVHPELQKQGVGTKLIDYIVNNEREKGRDAIGTSFGMNEPLLEFWRKSKFNVVRIGFTREQTSGEHAAIMLRPLNENGKKLSEEVVIRFNGQMEYWFDDVLYDVSKNIKKTFETKTNDFLGLTKTEETDLYSFIHYSRNYELCISSLNKLVIAKENEIHKNDFPEKYRLILSEKIKNKTHWKQIAKNLKLNGQDGARKLFHDAILYLVK